MFDCIGEGFKDGEEVLVCLLLFYYIYVFMVGMMVFFVKGI